MQNVKIQINVNWRCILEKALWKTALDIVANNSSTFFAIPYLRSLSFDGIAS